MAKQAVEILAKDVNIFSRFKFDLNNNEYFNFNNKRYYTRNCNKLKNKKENINSQEVK